MNRLKEKTFWIVSVLSLLVSLGFLAYHFIKPLKGTLPPSILNVYVHNTLSPYIHIGDNYAMKANNEDEDLLSLSSKSFFRYDLTPDSLAYLKGNNPQVSEEDLQKSVRGVMASSQGLSQLVQGTTNNWIHVQSKDPLDITRPQDSILFLQIYYKDGQLNVMDSYVEEDTGVKDFQKLLLSSLNSIVYESGNELILDSLQRTNLPWTIDEDVDIGVQKSLDTAKITLSMNQAQYQSFLDKANFELRTINLIRGYLPLALLAWILTIFIAYQGLKSQKERKGFRKFLDFFSWETVLLLVFIWLGCYVFVYENNYDLAHYLKTFGDVNAYLILIIGLVTANFTILLSAGYLALRIGQIKDQGAYYGFVQKTLAYKVSVWIRSLFRRSISKLEKSVLNKSIAPKTRPMSSPLVIVGGVTVCLVLGIFILAFPLLAIIFLVILVLFIGFFIHDFSEEMSGIIEGSNEIVKGNYDYKIPVEKTYFKGIANNFNRISSNLDGAVKEAVESAQVQSRLITNVGHDLKTPLTSILNYADLLNQEEDPEKMKAYAKTIHEKSIRLKVLIDHLFEVSQSGKEVKEEDLVDLNLRDLLNQVLGEWEDKFNKKGLQVISQIDDQLPVRLDGNRAQRIFDNLCSNISKYSLEGTRVYVDGKREDGQAQVVFKNISKDPLSPGQDYTGRFTRGDASRTSEGYGLGLAIAKSLTLQMGGSLDLSVDGDLFKLKVTFPLKKE